MREHSALAFGSPVCVCGPCIRISGRSEIGEATVWFRGFVGPGAPAVGCALAVWFGGAGLGLRQQWVAPWRVCFRQSGHLGLSL
jgi:hypothetical protein